MEPMEQPPTPLDARPRGRCDRGAGGRILWGLFLFLFGGLLLFDRFGWVDASNWTYLWPLFPILIGAYKIVRPCNGGDRFFGGLLILIFGAIFLRHFDWFEFDLDGRVIFPAVLLAIGIRLMTTPRRSGRRGRNRRPTSIESGDEVGTFAMLGSSKIANTSSSFAGGRISAVLGSCEIDLRGASMAEGSEAVLDVFALWGGIDVLVPESWTVVVNGTPILAGFEDQTQAPSTPAGRLVITGFALMGGVEIKNQRKRAF